MKFINSKNILKIIFFIVFFSASSVDSSLASDVYSKYFIEIEKVSTWDDLKKISMEYPDDGVFSEGFSEKVEWLFHNKYPDFFKKEIFKDKKFFKFIKRHIDHTWLYGSTEKLELKLLNNCPTSCEKICKDLLEKIEYENALENQ
jgi:hypothetical protein